MSLVIGPKTVFNNNFSAYVAADMVKTTGGNTFVCAYEQQVGHDGTAIAGQMASDATFTFGSKVVFDAAGYNYHNTVCRLTESKFVICYEDNNYDGVAIIGTLEGEAGLTISFGAPQFFEQTGNVQTTSAARLTDDLFVIAYGGGKVRAISVSGTVMTIGAAATYGGSLVNHLSITPMTSSSFVVAYNTDYNEEPYNAGKVVMGTVSGTTITLGTAVTYDDDDVYDMAVTALTDTRFVVIYTSQGREGRAIIGEINETEEGTTITFGDVTVWHAYGPEEYLSVAKMEDDRIIVSYIDENDGAGKYIVGLINDNIISFPMIDGETFSAGMHLTNSTMKISRHAFVVAFRDSSNGYYGTVIGVVPYHYYAYDGGGGIRGGGGGEIPHIPPGYNYNALKIDPRNLGRVSII